MKNRNFKSVLICVFLALYGCSNGDKFTHYSLSHIQILSVMTEASASYIKKNAQIIVHIRSAQLDQDIERIFEKLDSSSSQRRAADYIEAYALLVRHADGAEFRLGDNEDYSYLVIYHDDKAVCDQSLHAGFYNKLRNPS